MKKIILWGTAFALWIMPVAIVYASNTDNDVVLHQDQYKEFFKNEGHRKNYLYTRTTQDAPPPGKCYVYTGNSEQTIAVVCNMTPS